MVTDMGEPHKFSFGPKAVPACLPRQDAVLEHRLKKKRVRQMTLIQIFFHDAKLRFDFFGK